MSLFSSRVGLIHRTTVQRDASVAGTPNDWGTPQAPDWQNHLTDVPCLGWTNTGREQIDATTSVVVEDMRCIVPLGTDVSELDRLSDVTYRGEVVISGPVGVRAVVVRRDHLELVLVRIA